MKLNCKRLGNYIQQVGVRNDGFQVKDLQGISINKEFMPSVANVIGTNLSKYKIVKKGKFAYNPMHVGRDEVLPISLLQDKENVIVSPAYVVFEIIDVKQLLPEYLMMWLRRSEFDRRAWFTTDSSVRGGFNWDDFSEMEISLPEIETQKALARQYNKIVNRIKLNERYIKKLKETAQAIYKHWFVDSEFPDAIGKPYKSNNGQMEFNKELDREIPMDWRVGQLSEIIELFDSERIPLSKFERNKLDKTYPYYGAASILDYVDDFIFDGTYVLLGEDGSVITENGRPVLQYVSGKFWVNNHAHVIQGKNGFNVDSIYLLLSCLNVSEIITGGVQAKISQINLKSLPVLIPDTQTLSNFNDRIKPLFEIINNIVVIDDKFCKLCELLLSKLTTLENYDEIYRRKIRKSSY